MRKFGHRRPTRDNAGNPIGFQDSPAQAVTINELGARFGVDSRRKLVVSLEAGDQVTVRPTGTRRVYRIDAKDLYFHLLRCEANKVSLERARERKAVKEAQRKARAIKAAEIRLFKSAA